MYGKIRALLAASEAPSQGVVSLDVELLIRLLEWAREEVKADVPLHVAAERLASVCADGKTATMADYLSIVPNDPEQTSALLATAGIGDPTVYLKLSGRGDFDWRGLLSTLGTLGGWGASRSVVVAPDDADTRRELESKGLKVDFYYDGDGADCILEAEVNNERVWPPAN